MFTYGTVGQWTVAQTTGREYFEQMTAEIREEKVDSRGRTRVLWVQKRRDNHYLDCELMIHTAAIITGMVKAVNEKQVESEEMSG